MPCPTPMHMVAAAAAGAAAAELVQQGGGDPCARAAERVADRDGPAVDVHPVGVELELVGHRHRLRRERLVDLDQVEPVHRPARPAEHLAHRRDRPDPHVVRVHARRGGAHIPGHRRGPGGAGEPSLRGQQQACRPVVERRGVAAGDRAAGAECGPLRGQLVHCQAGPDALVAAQLARPGARPGRSRRRSGRRPGRAPPAGGCGGRTRPGAPGSPGSARPHSPPSPPG